MLFHVSFVYITGLLNVVASILMILELLNCRRAVALALFRLDAHGLAGARLRLHAAGPKLARPRGPNMRDATRARRARRARACSKIMYINKTHVSYFGC